MKKNLFFLLLALAAVSIPSMAQSQFSDNISIYAPFTDYCGTINYTYTVNDDGERIKNGPINITGKQNETYNNVDITGSYVLKASAKNGYMDGPMSVSAKYHGVAHYWSGDKVEDYVYSMTGDFQKGIPNGNFTAKATGSGSCNVNYKDGILVGAYSIDESIDRTFVTISGNLNDKGQMIGAWTIEDLGDVSQWEFVNGIRVKVSSKKEESTPKQIEYAKKYATGAISKEDLESNGFFPVQDSIRLGDYVADLLLLNNMARWEDLAWFSFRKSLWVKYTYLYNVLPLPDKQFQEALSEMKTNGRFHNDFDENSKVLGYDELAKIYTVSFYKNYGTPNVKLITRALTNEQLSQVLTASKSFWSNYPLKSIDDYYKSIDKDVRFSVLEKNFNEIKKEDIMAISETGGLPKNSERTYNELLKKIESAERVLNDNLGKMEKSEDGIYYIFREGLRHTFLPVEEVEKFYSFAEKVREYSSTRDVMLKKAEEKREKFTMLFSSCKESLSQLIGQTSSSSPSFVNATKYYYTQGGTEPGVKELYKMVKPYFPITSIDIEEPDINSLDINGKEFPINALITKGKNKTIYRAHLTVDSKGRILMESLNIKNAEKL